MSQRTKYFVFASLVAGSSFAVMPSHAAPAAGECLSGPNRVAPDGSHWYYRIDRANNNRKCWYLAPENEKARASARHRVPDPPPAKAEPGEAAAPAAPQPIAAGEAAAPATPQPVASAAAAEPAPASPATSWPDPALAGFTVVTPAENPAPEPLASEPDTSSASAVADSAPPEAAPAIDLKLMLALLTAALVLAGIIGRMTFQHLALRPLRRAGLDPEAELGGGTDRRRSAPHESIVPILANASPPDYFDQLALSRGQEEDLDPEAEPALEELEQLLHQVRERISRSAA
jgi:hypothetical protein